MEHGDISRLPEIDPALILGIYYYKIKLVLD